MGLGYGKNGRQASPPPPSALTFRLSRSMLLRLCIIAAAMDATTYDAKTSGFAEQQDFLVGLSKRASRRHFRTTCWAPSTIELPHSLNQSFSWWPKRFKYWGEEPCPFRTWVT